MILRIATRGSKLALWQAHHVRERLIAGEPDLTVELLVLKTTGDRILDRPLSEVGGKGLFVKEIEEALCDGRADVAVHSMKDLPAELASGLSLAAVPAREDPRDALLVRPGLHADRIEDLPVRARVGTSSLRRVCVLKSLRPDLDVQMLRGNVDTRLRKLDEGQVDAIVLAAAGLNRLGFADRIAVLLPVEVSLPAIGQGALAVEARTGDDVTRVRLARLDDAATATATTAERAFLGRLGGSCRTPIAAHAVLTGGGSGPITGPLAGGPDELRLSLEGFVGRPDGTLILRDRITGAAKDAAALGVTLAERLLARGAAQILADCAVASSATEVR